MYPIASAFSVLVSCLLFLPTTQKSVWDELQEDVELKTFFSTLEPYDRSRNDVVFVLDESGSIGEDVFPQVIVFTEMIARQLSVSREESQLAVITYGSYVRDHITFEQSLLESPNMCTFLRDLAEISYNGGGTNTGSALIRAKEILDEGRILINKIIFLLTDGNSNEGPNVNYVSSELRESGVIIFAVGVASINEDELKVIASSDDHIYKLKNFGFISSLNEYLINDTKEVNFDRIPDKSLCNSYCSGNKDCCDIHADCFCGTKTGRYECSCTEGFGGSSGYKGQCRPCPVGTYKDKVGNYECFLCPANSTTLSIGSKSRQDCRCISGHVGNPQSGQNCQPIECNELKAPVGGVLIPKTCGHFYGSKCTFKCFPGYCPFACRKSSFKPLGDILPEDFSALEPRKCLESGKWSGEDFFCEKITCPALSFPKYGTHNCSSDVTDYGVGTVCAMTCDKGSTLTGSFLRTCLINRTWTGEETSCKARRCPPLKTNIDLMVKPVICSLKDMPYQSTCFYYCTKDKTLVSYDEKTSNESSILSVRSCQNNGKWSNFNVTIYCKDTEAPQIHCPSSIEAEAEHGKPVASISWDWPVVKDNVDDNLAAYIIEPKHAKPPHAFSIGKTKVVYEAIDSAGNIKTCSFLVTVHDTEPPNVEKCPLDIIIQHSEKSGIKVYWEEPQFSDNSGNVSIISINRKSGDLFYWGPTSIVTYQAADPSGNIANCSFQVMVKAHTCDYTEPPANGYLVCDRWTNGQLCSPICSEGYSFSHVTEPVYFCSQKSKKWGRVPGSVPRNKFVFPWGDCGAIQPPKSVNIDVEVGYYVNRCSDENELIELKEKFIAILMAKHKIFCPVKKGCHVKNVDVHCNEPVEIGRSKRSTDFVSSRFEDEKQAYVEPKIHLQKAWHQLEAKHRKRQSEENTLLVISFSMEVENNESNSLDHGCENCTTVEDFHQMDIIGVVETAVTETAQEVYHLNDSVIGKKFKYNIVLVCKEGSVLENSTCVNCPIGTYFNETTSSCKVCSLKHYQDEEGSMSCKPCPDGKTTMMTKSKRIEDCRGPCRPGTFSKTGLEPCLACPKGLYQEDWSSTYCLNCPSNMKTLSTGATSPGQCASPCTVGSYSHNGYSPCLLCPFGTYQSFQQQTNCFKCPMGTTTVVTGASKVDYCQTVHFCKDFKPCTNGARCTDDGVSYKCTCPPGFTGKNCDININECYSGACENNGTCVDETNEFSCVCGAGFNGRRCELNIDDCSPDPCENGGTCVDLIDDYQCDCMEGFFGINCEFKIDKCNPNPCMNGGKCFEMHNDYRCCCPVGYSGYNCNIEINKCESEPCNNGGSCVPSFNSFTCLCPPGYEGSHCEMKIDFCSVDSCYNGGTCISGTNSSSCSCPLMYFGKQCENVVPSEFAITFEKPTTYNYILLHNNRHLPGITLSFHMRNTNSDEKQRGTPISYSYYNTKTAALVDNGLTLYDIDKLILYIHGIPIYTGYSANSDWHHYAVTWDSKTGSWSIYIDAKLHLSGTGLGVGEHMYPGAFVLGQEQDGLGEGFSILESFVGKITEFNVWDYAFTSEEVQDIAKFCGFVGNVVSWPLTLKHLHGDLVYSTDFKFCSKIGRCSSNDCYCKSSTGITEICEHKVDNCSSMPCANNQTCVSQGPHFSCNCSAGYEGRLCEYDVNECLVDNGKCSYKCVNTNGSYSCTCPDHMVLEENGFTCKSNDFCKIENKVYYDGEMWLQSCDECVCTKGVVKCEPKTCSNKACSYGEEEITLPGSCCSTCLSIATSCTIHPNNTIETLDALQFMFHGTCKYTLLTDCYDGTLDVSFQATNESNIGKSVDLYVMCEKVSILPNGKVTINDMEVSLPFRDNMVTIDVFTENLSVFSTEMSNEEATTGNNFSFMKADANNSADFTNGSTIYVDIHILTMHGAVIHWHLDGGIEIKLPDIYQKKTCGLCGNFNGIPKDDLSSKTNSSTRIFSDFADCYLTASEVKSGITVGCSAVQRNVAMLTFVCLMCLLLSFMY